MKNSAFIVDSFVAAAMGQMFGTEEVTNNIVLCYPLRCFGFELNGLTAGCDCSMVCPQLRSYKLGHMFSLQNMYTDR